MIKIENIRKSFGNLEVLKGIDLEIEKGEIVSIVGPSGAGKTTLLQIIGTLDKPDSGRIIIDEIDTSKLSKKDFGLSESENWVCIPVSSAASRIYRIRKHYDTCIHCWYE